MEAPRILHIATRYLRGGSEQRIRDIVRAIPEAEHHVVVGADSDLQLARHDLHPESLEMVTALVRSVSPADDAAALWTLVRMVKRAPFDLAVTHQSKAGVLGRVACRLAGGPPAIHSLSMANFGPGYPRWQDLAFRKIEARLHRWTEAYAVVGSDLATRYAQIGVPAEKLSVVRSGVRLPTERRSEALRWEVRREHGLPSDRPIILYLGSLEARKNVLDLVPFLRALIDAAGRRRPFLAVAGEGPLFGRLESSFVAGQLSGDAILLGYQMRPGRLIAAADAVILLSSAEGVPQMLVQAAAVGTPFVSYDVDGVRELLALGARGEVVRLGDVEAAAHVMKRLLVGTDERPVSMDTSSWAPDAIVAEYRLLVRRAFEKVGRSPRPVTQLEPAMPERALETSTMSRRTARD